MVILASFWKTEACGQTVLPDMSILIRQKLMENAEVEKYKCDIWVIFKHCVHSNQKSYFLCRYWFFSFPLEFPLVNFYNYLDLDTYLFILKKMLKPFFMNFSAKTTKSSIFSIFGENSKVKFLLIH